MIVVVRSANERSLKRSFAEQTTTYFRRRRINSQALRKRTRSRSMPATCCRSRLAVDVKLPVYRPCRAIQKHSDAMDGSVWSRLLLVSETETVSTHSCQGIFPRAGGSETLDESALHQSLKKTSSFPPAPAWQSMQPFTCPARRLPSLVATLPSGLYFVQYQPL